MTEAGIKGGTRWYAARTRIRPPHVELKREVIMEVKVLVAYGSKNGSTAGIADMIASTLLVSR